LTFRCARLAVLKPALRVGAARGLSFRCAVLAVSPVLVYRGLARKVRGAARVRVPRCRFMRSRGACRGAVYIRAGPPAPLGASVAVARAGAHPLEDAQGDPAGPRLPGPGFPAVLSGPVRPGDARVVPGLPGQSWGRSVLAPRTVPARFWAPSSWPRSRPAAWPTSTSGRRPTARVPAAHSVACSSWTAQRTAQVLLGLRSGAGRVPSRRVLVSVARQLAKRRHLALPARSLNSPETVTAPHRVPVA
jgi:hypothetical protein